MTRVVIVGELYNADLTIGGGPMPGGPGGAQPPLGIWGPGQMPPGFWGGGMGPGVKPQPPGTGPVDPGYGVDAGLRPTHPIYNPAYPDHTLPQPPLGTWGGGNVPFPTPPIYIGPPVPAPEPPPPIEWHSAWTPQTGWMTVGIPSGEHPTPSTE